MAELMEGQKAPQFDLPPDGQRTVDGVECKNLKDPTLKRFRGMVLKL